MWRQALQRARQRCTKGETDTISVRAAAEVGYKAQAGDRLVVNVKSPDGAVAEGFNMFSVVAADAPPIQWAHRAARAKVVRIPRRPQGAALASFREPIVSLELASEEWEDAWWARQQQEMQVCSLQEGEDEGGLLKDALHRPDTSVLGPWMRGVMHAEGHEANYPKPPEGNPEWMKTMGSVLILWLVACMHLACMKNGKQQERVLKCCDGSRKEATP